MELSNYIYVIIRKYVFMVEQILRNYSSGYRNYALTSRDKYGILHLFLKQKLIDGSLSE